MDVEGMFYVMRDATVCLSDKNKEIAFNGMCHTLYSKWNIEKHVLGKLMIQFGYVYMESCSECCTDYKWYDVCPECNNDYKSD